MPQNYSGRIAFIVAVLLAALIMIFPPKSLFDTSLSFSQKLNLKPGIDMVGGTSLLYEIKAAPGAMRGNLAEQVMEALKRRVDPQGVRNLIWRPQGSNQLEIQMPMSSQSGKAKQTRADYTAARDTLQEMNVRPSKVIQAVEKLTGAQRADELKKLAMGSPTRERLFVKLAETYDQIRAAEKAQNAQLQARKEPEYDKLKNEIDSTNLNVGDVEQGLDRVKDLKKALAQAERDKTLAEVDAKAGDVPGRAEALAKFEKIYADYTTVKGSIDDAGELKRLLRGSGVLEFHMLVEGSDMSSPEAIEMQKRLAKGGKGTAVQAGDTMRWYQVDRPEDAPGGAIVQTWNDKKWALAWTTPDKELVNGTGWNRWALESAYPTSDGYGMRAVGFRFDAQGAKYFGEMTGNNLKKLMAVMLDDKIISAATIQSTISRDGIITRGNGYTDDEFKYLISTLSAGSLPAQLAEEPIREQTIEAQLGAENLRAGLISCVFGLVIVAVFLVVYYYRAGFVATFAVCMNVLLVLGSMAAINATFTLPGIAGIVLAIGAAVDANVLIFERLREEQHRGLSLRMALRNAYDRAFSAILDSNVTTLITALILSWVGSEEVKGFGITLLIGLCWSLFTALFVTKTIFGIMVDKFGVTQLGSLPLTFPNWDKKLKPNWDWIGMSWIFITISGVLMVAGLIAFGAKWHSGEVLAIDFAGGTGVRFELNEAMPKPQVKQALEKYRATALPDFNVMKVGNQETEYEILTPNTDATKVRTAILRALEGKLKLEQPSQFDEAADPVKPLETVLNSAVLPIENESLSIPTSGGGTFTASTASSHVGGVAIVLRNLTPPLPPQQIKARIERQRLMPQAGEQAHGTREIDVEAMTTNDQGQATSAVVLVSDPNLPYSGDPAKWQEGLAAPAWKLVNEAVNNPPQLQQVTNFGPQVAGDTTQAALLALVLSVLVIMAYIWLRFGNLLYGTATVVAMLHDTLLVLGLIGLSHYLADTAVGRALLIDAGFRIDLTMVAAILTVMSYSMIDTIVVFDRIRENRGKFGLMSRQVINDSINQTLSRTLLTGTTNIFTVLVMYVIGGPGIHGFTFVLLSGILVGTYSSVAIASPMLLIGAGKQVVSRKLPTGNVQRLGA